MHFPFGYIVALLLIQVYPFKGQFNSTASKQIHILHFKIKKINEFDDSLTFLICRYCLLAFLVLLVANILCCTKPWDLYTSQSS